MGESGIIVPCEYRLDLSFRNEDFVPIHRPTFSDIRRILRGNNDDGRLGQMEANPPPNKDQDHMMCVMEGASSKLIKGR